jgi:hypothetical protein
MPGLGGHREELNGFPAIFNIEQDPREEANVLATSGWVIAQYLRLIGEYEKSLEKYPTPRRSTLLILASECREVAVIGGESGFWPVASVSAAHRYVRN